MKHRYKTDVFSKILTPSFNIEPVLQSLAELSNEHNKRISPRVRGDELENLKEKYKDGLIIIVAQDVANGNYVSYGLLIPDNQDRTQIEFGDAYVLPKYRRQGIFGQIVDAADLAASKSGFRKIVAFPAIDGHSRRVLERHGYTVIKEDDIGQTDLIKHLSSSKQELETTVRKDISRK